jgi:hypothetical protein
VIRDLMPEDINQLVSVSGMVTRCSSVIPEMQCAPRRPRPRAAGGILAGSVARGTPNTASRCMSRGVRVHGAPHGL